MKNLLNYILKSTHISTLEIKLRNIIRIPLSSSYATINAQKYNAHTYNSEKHVLEWNN